MTGSHVVSGLVVKRTELAGLVDHHRREIARIAGDLGHVDATIKMFAPEIDLNGVRAREYRERNRYFRRGERPRVVLDALRTAGQILTTRQLTERVMVASGMELTTGIIESVQKSVLVIVKALQDKEKVCLQSRHRHCRRVEME